MGKFKKIATGIEGVSIIESIIFEDNRGFFMETYSKREFEEIGIDTEFVQDNHSKSTKGVLRGLHFQKEHPQSKLVRVLKGEIYDVVVDLRKNSATYGKYYGIFLSEENKLQLLVPKGFAHGFLVISEEAEFVYKCDDFYHQGDESGLIWNDATIGIKWPLDKVGGIGNIIQSDKDKKLNSLLNIV